MQIAQVRRGSLSSAAVEEAIAVRIANFVCSAPFLRIRRISDQVSSLGFSLSLGSEFVVSRLIGCSFGGGVLRSVVVSLMEEKKLVSDMLMFGEGARWLWKEEESLLEMESQSEIGLFCFIDRTHANMHVSVTVWEIQRI